MQVLNDLLRSSGSESCSAAAVCVQELTGAEQPSSTRLSLWRCRAIVCISATLTGDERSLFCVHIAGTVIQPVCKPGRNVKGGNRNVDDTDAHTQDWRETGASQDDII